MALAEILELSRNKELVKKVGLSEERIRAQLPKIREYVSFWREYPDMFIDFLQTGESE